MLKNKSSLAPLIHDIDDFQVLITPQGRVLVHDPLGFRPRDHGDSYAARFVETMIDDAKKNAAKSKEGN